MIVVELPEQTHAHDSMKIKFNGKSVLIECVRPWFVPVFVMYQMKKMYS